MFDFVTFAFHYHIFTTTDRKQVSRNWVGIRCPFCLPPDTGHHLGFSLLSGGFSCWKCGKHSAYEVVVAFSGETGNRIWEVIYKYRVNDSPNWKKEQRKKRAERISLPEYSLRGSDRSYLRDRRFSPGQLTRDYGLRSGGIAGKWKFRIVIPILNEVGEIVSAIGRTTALDVEPRYKDMPEEQCITPTKEVLYGLHMIESNCGVVIVVEGAFDMMRIGPGSVATCGVGITEKQESILANRFDHVIIAFDGDDAGRERAQSLGESLSVLGVPDVEAVDLPEGSDPADLDKSEVEELRGLLYE